MPFGKKSRYLGRERKRAKSKAVDQKIKLLIELMRKHPQIYPLEARLIPGLEGVTGYDFGVARSALKREGVEIPLLKRGSKPKDAILLGTKQADTMRIVYDELIAKNQRKTLGELRTIIKERTGREISEGSIGTIISLMRKYMQIEAMGTKISTRQEEETIGLVKERRPKIPLNELQPGMHIELVEKDRPLICIVLEGNVVKPIYMIIKEKYQPLPKRTVINAWRLPPKQIILTPNSRFNMVTLRE